ncbi:RDD family protein [Lacimicrobium alkaliphilum]|uniref:RDD domain protein n=1 Tax=Lacimicrobium alkaliphilum TaxID=1526571 RepID=A0ABQ1RFR1_9ALTE|nr:RDD family protein [Lacimicrobium alkaliphilum]GGD68928.1 RDD domain protein [Lacimicrobium alkaliphilum]
MQTSSTVIAESRDYITPYAFEVPSQLYGIALAKPWKRGVAILVDLLLVALLTHINTLFMAAAASAVLVRSSSRLRSKGRYPVVRKLLAGVAGLLLFVVIFGALEAYREATTGESSVTEMAQKAQQIGDVGRFTANMVQMGMTTENIRSGDCAPAMECWQTISNKLLDDLARFTLPQNKQREIINAMYQEAEGALSTAQLSEFKQQTDNRYAEIQVTQEEERRQSEELGPEQAPDDTTEIIAPLGADESDKPGIIAWFKGILSDLGLGFGWAALYFTVFTAWWKGQTPGKKLLGLSVVRLDGRAPNLWESFGRYGGYGAGLATGLLGFVQVFWDINRQAIQDKISETLVLDLRKPRVSIENAAQASNDDNEQINNS